MKKYEKILTFFIICMLGLNSAHASLPLWTFTPLTSTTGSVTVNSSMTVQYRVTNQSRKTHSLVMQTAPGVRQITTAGNCNNPFVLAYQQSCTLSLVISGVELTGNVVGGPIVCEHGNPLQCYRPSQADSLNITLEPSPTLTSSVSTLALSVNDPATNAALTGTPRTLIITNTGTVPAVNVGYSVSPAFPAGSSIAPASCGTIAPSATCVLTITPGSTPSAAPNDTSPTPITLTVSGSNTNTVIPTVNILTYGSVYQSGYVFSVDDTTPVSTSIGGKVSALNFQSDPAGGIEWSTTMDSIWAIDQTSTALSPSPNSPPATQLAGQLNCEGKNDGACNTNNIYIFYNPTVSSINYAAGLCKLLSVDGYADWYLPAICELGFDSLSLGTGCATTNAAALQNIQGNLALNNLGNITTGFYWASTENAAAPQFSASQQELTNGPGSIQFYIGKNAVNGVLCARAFTP